MTNGWLVSVCLSVALAALVGLLALRKSRRRGALTRAAEQLGLRYSEGDPLGLGRGLGADVYETIWGRFQGADIAVATASRPVTKAHWEDWETSSVGVSLRTKVVRGLEVAQQAAGPTARVGLMNDGRLAVRSRPPRERTNSPLHPHDLPVLLNATARATRSQYA